MAEFTTPTTASSRQRVRNGGIRRRAKAIASSTTAAIDTRTYASGIAPSAGTATRMKTNEPPHSAASARSSATARGGKALDPVLEIEELLLPREPAAVTGQRAVCADDPVAGHD